MYTDNGASVEAVLTHAGDVNGRPFPGLSPTQDAELIGAIADQFRQLQRAVPSTEANLDSVCA
ncbi:hypothetical protein D3C80_1920530 [compost metagenome]